MDSGSPICLAAAATLVSRLAGAGPGHPDGAADFRIEEATIADIQRAITDGRVTARRPVLQSLRRIEQDDPRYRLAPVAARADRARRGRGLAMVPFKCSVSIFGGRHRARGQAIAGHAREAQTGDNDAGALRPAGAAATLWSRA